MDHRLLLKLLHCNIIQVNQLFLCLQSQMCSSHRHLLTIHRNSRRQSLRPIKFNHPIPLQTSLSAEKTRLTSSQSLQHSSQVITRTHQITQASKLSNSSHHRECPLTMQSPLSQSRVHKTLKHQICSQTMDKHRMSRAPKARRE